MKTSMYLILDNNGNVIRISNQKPRNEKFIPIEVDKNGNQIQKEKPLMSEYFINGLSQLLHE